MQIVRWIIRRVYRIYNSPCPLCARPPHHVFRIVKILSAILACVRSLFYFPPLTPRCSSLRTSDSKTKRLPKPTVAAQRANAKKVILKFDYRKFRSHSVVMFSKNKTNTKILKFPLSLLPYLILLVCAIRLCKRSFIILSVFVTGCIVIFLERMKNVHQTRPSKT